MKKLSTEVTGGHQRWIYLSHSFMAGCAFHINERSFLLLLNKVHKLEI